MRSAVIFAFILCLMTMARAASNHDHQHGQGISVETPKVIDTSTVQLSKGKNFRVSYESDPIPMNKVHVWKLKVEMPDGHSVTGAVIKVDGGMPEHGHGLPTKPQVTEEPGHGRYLVEGMKFNMPGWWVVTFSIIAGDKTDTVTFNLDLK